MIKVLPYLALAAALCASAASADCKSKNNGSTGVFIVANFESPIINNSSLNASLSSLSLPAARIPIATGGLAIEGRLNNIAFSVGYSTGKRRPKLTTSELVTTYTQAGFNLGYDLLPKPYRSLYPYLGFKACLFKYSHNSKFPNTSSPTYGQYFSTTLDHKEIQHSKLVLDLGAGYSMQRTYYFGVRAGYMLNLTRDRWAINNDAVELAGGPSLNYTAYITLSIGFGFMERDDEKMKKRQKTDVQQM